MQKLCHKKLAHRAHLNFQTANIIKAALKLEAFFSSIKDNASKLIVRLSLNPPPVTFQL